MSCSNVAQKENPAPEMPESSPYKAARLARTASDISQVHALALSRQPLSPADALSKDYRLRIASKQHQPKDRWPLTGHVSAYSVQLHLPPDNNICCTRLKFVRFVNQQLSSWHYISFRGTWRKSNKGGALRRKPGANSVVYTGFKLAMPRSVFNFHGH